jgi:predicted ArsR family transcriptional regulator
MPTLVCCRVRVVDEDPRPAPAGNRAIKPAGSSADVPAVDPMDPAVDPIDAVAALAEPTRRRLYDWVVAERRPVGRDEAAAAIGVGRPLAAFHLDRLVAAGLLAAEYRRLSGRSGPGAGRPAKLYRRTAEDIAVRLPDRRYELAARLFAEGIEADPDEAAVTADVAAAATRRGTELGSAVRERAGARPPASRLRKVMLEVLDENGYAPRELDGEIRFANCPFDALVADHRPLICGANVALASGLVGDLAPLGLTARLDPQPGWCCVVLAAAEPPA